MDLTGEDNVKHLHFTSIFVLQESLESIESIVPEKKTIV